MFQRLLICTDLTDGLQRLVNFVPCLAASGVKQITFLHAIPLSEDQAVPHIDEAKTNAARDRLAPAQARVPDGVEVKIEVLWGKPTDLILNVAKTVQADLIFLGTPIRSLLSEKLFGSTTMGVSQRTQVPILLFRPQLLSTYMNEELDLRCRNLFRYFLLAYDGGQAADYLIDQIKFHAQNRPPEMLKECLLCWVIDEGGRRDLPRVDQVKEAESRLESVKADLEALDIKVGAEVRLGEPILEILSAADRHNISAIACASDSLGTFMEWSTPCFTREILRRSWHPVLYFPLPRK